jgi:hypothetical protein
LKLKLETVLASVGLLRALAYALGFLKSLYYFSTFGIGLRSLDLSPQDYLFESWFGRMSRSLLRKGGSGGDGHSTQATCSLGSDC